MLDLCAIDEAVERLARELLAIEKVRRWERPFSMPEVRMVLDPPNWTGVSWVMQLRGRGDYPFRKLCKAELERTAREVGAGQFLLERLLPDFGFAQGDVELPYGRRGTLRLSLGAGNEVTTTLDGRAVSSLPAPLKDDNAEAIREARAKCERLKREVRRIDRLLGRYLHEMMHEGRHWTADVWRAAAANPLFRNVAMGRLFATFGDPMNRLRGFFALDECGEAVGTDHAPVSLDGRVVRAAQPAVIDDEVRHRWGAWFAEHRRFGAWLDDQPPTRSGPDPATSRICSYSWFDRFAGQDLLATNRRLVALGWNALRYPSGDKHWRGTPWFDKELAPGGPWATFLSSGGSTHINHISLVLTSGRFSTGSNEEDWLAQGQVSRPQLAEVMYDIDHASGRRPM